MSIENVILWYEKNVNYKITRIFLNFLVNIGIIKNDVDLELLNSFMLEAFGDEYVKEDNFLKIKKNRIPIIDKFKDEPITINKEKTNTKEIQLDKIINTAVKENNKQPRNKFKIENLGGKKLKLVKL